MAMVSATSSAPGGATEMVLVVMLPADDQVMIIQTSRLGTIGELEEFIVAEHGRVFPHKPALGRHIRVQKCMPRSLVINRRMHEGTASAGGSSSSHHFVDLSKTVQVGNVFENLEQIYVVSNKPTAPATTKPLALPTPAAAPVAHEASAKMKKKAKKDAMAHQETAAPTPQQKQQQQTKKQPQPQPTLKETNASKKHIEAAPTKKPQQPSASKAPEAPASAETESQAASASSGSSSATATVPAIEETSTESMSAKRGRKARKVSVDVSPTEQAHEPPSKKAKLSVTTTAAPATVAPQNAVAASVAQPVVEPPKKKRGRKSNAEKAAEALALALAAEVVEPTVEPPKKKRGRKSNAEKAAEAAALAAAEAAKAAIAPPPAETEKHPAKRSKPEVVNVVDDSPVTETNSDSDETKAHDPPTPKRLVRREKPVSKENVGQVGGQTSTKPVRRSFQETLAAARERVEADKRAKEQTEAPESPVKQVRAGSNSPSSVNTEPSSAAKPSKRGFHEILAAARERLEADKSKNDEANDGNTSSENNAEKTTQPETIVVKATQDSSTSSDDSDFEDSKPSLPRVPTKTQTKTAPSSSKPVSVKPKETSTDDSTDDEELDYSQSLLAELSQDDPKVVTKPASQFLPESSSTTPKEKKSRAPRKTKIVLPTDDADVVQNSQEAMSDLSQDLLSQKGPESNSVLVSSLSKNRFSLDNIPVAKLKKSSKNPFATAADKPADPPKRGRGRPRKNP